MKRTKKTAEPGGRSLTSLQDTSAPDLEAISKRRKQIWSLTLFLLVSAVSFLALASVANLMDVDLSSPRAVLFIGVVVLVILFSVYTFKVEIKLRSLTEEVLDEQVLIAALTNINREARLATEDRDEFLARVTLNQILDVMLKSCVELLGAHGGSIMLLHGEDELQTASSIGKSAARGARVLFNEGIAWQVAASHQPMLIMGVFDWEHYQDKFEAPRPDCAMCVPLLEGERLIGVLNLNASPERRFSELHLRATSVFGREAGRAIARAQNDEFQGRRSDHAGLRIMHDPLTGLPNRTLLSDRVGNALSRRRPPDHAVVVLFVDLDDFKRVNDSLGHTAGDQVLIMLAERLRSCVRMGDSVAHFGGDEFAVLLEAADSAEATAAAKRILSHLNQPFPLEAHEVRFSASIGIALESSSDARAEDVIRDAMTALHHAKAKGKGQVATFEKSMHSSAINRLDLEHDLRNAVACKELDVYFQPLMHIPELKVYGFEALVRWRHPQKGLVSAISFVPLAEEAGLQPLIDRMVLQKTCAEVVKLNKGLFVGRPVTAHVNLSPISLNQTSFVSNLVTDIMESGIDPSHLVLEITESVIMHDMEQAASRLRSIKSLGVRLALDDFGTGYSSLSYLRRLPIDVVKIDKSFVEEIEKLDSAAALVQAILLLGKGLNFEVVAEGIETEAQMNRLVDLGCNLGQGYHLAHPLSSAEFTTFLGGIRQVS